MRAIWVRVAETRGSAPRDAGTAMRVTLQDAQGTIGGGALEHDAIGTARQMLRRGETQATRRYPLGPALGQCCGGVVTLPFSDRAGQLDDTGVPIDITVTGPPAPLWIWGAGHVGRAVVQALPARAFDVTWLDTGPERFHDAIPSAITAVPAVDLPRMALHAPAAALHLIFTYSHDVDLALCAALAQRPARFIGLIGSNTKRVRFHKRLAEMGLDATRICCPIGDKALGKAPSQIAIGVVHQLIGVAHQGLPA